jgi:hypothetical protein
MTPIIAGVFPQIFIHFVAGDTDLMIVMRVVTDSAFTFVSLFVAGFVSFFVGGFVSLFVGGFVSLFVGGFVSRATIG